MTRSEPRGVMEPTSPAATQRDALVRELARAAASRLAGRRLVVGVAGRGTPLVLRAEPDGTIAAELRADANEGALVTLGDSRHLLAPGSVLNIEVPEGETPMTVRSASGTVVWARGTLHATSGPLVIDIAAGRLPKVPSLGGKFVAGIE